VKVLFLNPIGALGGAEHVLLDVIASLRRTSPQLELELVALDDGPLLREASLLGVATDVVRLPESLASLGESETSTKPGHGWIRNARAAAELVNWLPKFAASLRGKRPTIIHSNGLKTHLLGALVRPGGVPLIWHLHDFVSERRVTARVLPLLQRRAAIAVAVSHAVAEDAHAVLKELRIEPLLNGIRTEGFTPGIVAPLDLDALAGLERAPSGTIRVGLVATYASWKGHHLFLEAAQQLAGRATGIRFYVIGGPVYSTSGSQVTRAELAHAISRLQLGERCGLVPFQENVAGVYAALDVVVQASTRREPFGRTVAEAMASGRTVVAAGTGGILEQIEDEKTGFLFQTATPAALGSLLCRVIDSPTLRARVSRNAVSFAREALDYARLGPRLLSFYEDLMARASGHERLCGEQRPSSRGHDPAA
jgi:glycosyltransferase involved in cell wall biosynthesis